MDASAYFLSGGGDGSVRVWARRRVVEEKAAAAATATEEENEAPADADGDAAAAAAAEPTEPPPPTYGWSADPRFPDIATAPIAARLVTSVDAALLDVKGVGVKALLVAREKISAGLSGASYTVQFFFTRPSVSTFDRVSFQLTDVLALYGLALTQE